MNQLIDDLQIHRTVIKEQGFRTDHIEGAIAAIVDLEARLAELEADLGQCQADNKRLRIAARVSLGMARLTLGGDAADEICADLIEALSLQGSQ